MMKQDAPNRAANRADVPHDPSIDARRITRTLFFVQSLGSAAAISIFPVFPILGAELTGRQALAGIPATVSLLGQALSAFGWGYAMDRLGRRPSLIAGMVIGMLASLLAAGGAVLKSFTLLLAGSVLVGVAASVLALARFVAAEVHPPEQRARAISGVVLGGTIGAVMGPLLAGSSARFARQGVIDELVAPFVVSLLLAAVAAVVLFIWLRPEPRELGQASSLRDLDTTPTNGPARGIGEILREPPALVAVTSMVFGQMVMAMLMVITSLHMRNHDHPLTSISFVISSHVVGMYGFSVISGRLADRWGRGPVIMAGAIILILATSIAPLSPQVVPLTVALFLLGLGWNFCYVAGSTMLADQLSPSERARTQGFNDLLIGLGSAVGSLGSGIVFAAIGYGAMGIVGAAAALIPLSMAAWWQLRQRAVAVAR
jgi:MFS family permease